MGELKQIFILTNADGSFKGDIFPAFLNRANAEAELRKEAGQITLFQEVPVDVQPDAIPTEDGPFPDVSAPEDDSVDSDGGDDGDEGSDSDSDSDDNAADSDSDSSDGLGDEDADSAQDSDEDEEDDASLDSESPYGDKSIL